MADLFHKIDEMHNQKHEKHGKYRSCTDTILYSVNLHIVWHSFQSSAGIRGTKIGHIWNLRFERINSESMALELRNKCVNDFINVYGHEHHIAGRV